jgi:hypothetical protein
MDTFYEICAIIVGGLAVGFVALLGLHKMGFTTLDPVHIEQNIVYTVRH